MIKSIRENQQYAEAIATRDSLSNALAAARDEESRLLAAMDATPVPRDKLKSALDLLENKPAVRADLTGLNRPLLAVREKIEILTQGIDEQNRAAANLAVELSGKASAGCAAAHGEAAQGIADALRQLEVAMTKEAAIRRALEEAGYRCTLPALVMMSNDFQDRSSAISRYLQECQNVATDAADTASGAIDKPASVCFLLSLPGHACGDVDVLPGREARNLVRLGRAEYSNEKPRKAQQPAAVRELVLS